MSHASTLYYGKFLLFDTYSLSGFAAEAPRGDLQKLHSWNICQCPEIRGTRIPDCQCFKSKDVSALLQVRWKRLVIDEGHVAAATSTNLTEFACVLSTERRWIVTGTPTTNLLGLGFGRDSDHTLVESGDCIKSIRLWTSKDREDVHKLSNMITHFLRVPHFAADPKLLKNVSSPLFDPEGPRPGAIQVLTQVMNMVMIRHQ